MARSEHEVKVERALSALVDRFGPDRAQDPQTLKALLADELGSDSLACAREIRLVTTALSEGVPQALDQGAVEGEVARSFGHTAAFQPDAASWAVRAWASALGTHEEPTPEPWTAPAPPPPPGPRVEQETQAAPSSSPTDRSGVPPYEPPTPYEGAIDDDGGAPRSRRGAVAWFAAAAILLVLAVAGVVIALVGGWGGSDGDPVATLAGTVGLSDTSSCAEREPDGSGSVSSETSSAGSLAAEMACTFDFDRDPIGLSVQQWDQMPDGAQFVSDRMDGTVDDEGDWSPTWGQRMGPYLEGSFGENESFIYWEYPDEDVTALITADSILTARRFWAANFVDAASPPDQEAMRGHFRIVSDPDANCVPDYKLFQDAQIRYRGGWSCLDNFQGTEISASYTAYEDEAGADISSTAERLLADDSYEQIDDGDWRLATGDVGGAYYAGQLKSTGSILVYWDYAGTPYRASAYGAKDYDVFLEWWESRGSLTN